MSDWTRPGSCARERHEFPTLKSILTAITRGQATQSPLRHGLPDTTSVSACYVPDRAFASRRILITLFSSPPKMRTKAAR
jgi:hypothetical protein